MMAKNERRGRKIVRSVFSVELYEIMKEICIKLGLSESDLLRIAFIDYAKELQKIREKLH